MDMAMMMTIMILILTDGMWRVLESLVGDREERDARGGGGGGGRRTSGFLQDSNLPPLQDSPYKQLATKRYTGFQTQKWG